MTDNKFRKLVTYLKQLKNVAIAFSGGVDSTFLVYAAKQALGKKVIAFTVNSPYIPEWEVEEAKKWIDQIGVRHKVINIQTPENINNNPTNRCYLCKKQIFSLLNSEAEKEGIQYLLEGTNKDDEGDYRPGMKALDELGILSPLREVGFIKEEIRQLSKEYNLPTWNKPAYACLLTRIPYDTEITSGELQRIEKGELQLFQLGFKGIRLRSHGNLARIEMQKEHFNLLNDESMRNHVVDKLKSCGYQFICIDLEGYRSGSYDHSITHK